MFYAPLVSRIFALTPLANIHFFNLCPLIFGLRPLAGCAQLTNPYLFHYFLREYYFLFTPTFSGTQIGRKIWPCCTTWQHFDEQPPSPTNGDDDDDDDDDNDYYLLVGTGWSMLKSLTSLLHTIAVFDIFVFFISYRNISGTDTEAKAIKHCLQH